MHKTMTLRRVVREMDLDQGDQFLLSGYSNRHNIHSDMRKLNEELGIDMGIAQKKMLLFDPVDNTVEECFLITVIKSDNRKRVVKRRSSHK